ncbi:hypothetical protein D3C78_1629550 [compost metagenome]
MTIPINTDISLRKSSDFGTLISSVDFSLLPAKPPTQPDSEIHELPQKPKATSFAPVTLRTKGCDIAGNSTIETP